MKTTLTRRAVLGGTALLAAPRIARGAAVPLVLGTNGGEAYRVQYEAVYASFEQKYNVRIVPLFGDAGTLLDRAIAEKSAPSMDAVMCFQGGWLTGQSVGVFERVDVERIPNIADVYDFMRDPAGFAPFLNFAAWGIVTNKDSVSTPPASIKALWNPGYTGKIMIGGIYHWQIHLAAFAQSWTGDQTRIDVAFDKARLLAPRLAGFYGLSSDAQSKFTQGVADTATWLSDVAQRLRNKGVPLAFRIPEEGAFLYPMTIQAVAGSSKRDMVEKLIGHFYDPDVCRRLAAADGRIPGNRRATLDPALGAQILSIEDVMRANRWNWSFINTHQNAWLTRWNSEIRPLVNG